MADRVNDIVKEYAKFGKGRSIWQKILTFLAVVTVFITVYMLILPAITQEVPTYCGYKEHSHTDVCYEYVEEYNCGEDHEHFSECLVQLKTLKCLTAEHMHVDRCYAEPIPLTEDVANDEYDCCLTPEHTHTEECYGEEGLPLCGHKEHTHSNACIWGTPENDEFRVNNVIALIDAIPAYEEVDAKFTEFDDNEDYDGYEEYYWEIYSIVCAAYVNYEDLENELRERVTNRDDLLVYNWLYDGQVYSVTEEKTVKFHNYYDNATANQTMLVYGGTVGSKSTFGFAWWYAVVVDEDEYGNLCVTRKVTAGTGMNKSSLAATSARGFVLLSHNSTFTCSVGDYVTVSYNYMNTAAGHKSDGYGTVTFDNTAPYSGKPEKDNSSQLTVVPSADTYELIKVNLFDYTSNINDKYNTDPVRYPGFQQGGGSGSSFASLGSGTFNYGDNITADLAAGHSGVTTRNGTGGINEMNPIKVADRPTLNAMSLLIGDDGHPKLANGESLSWLFSDGTYAKKQNTDNINGLFQRNSTTGEYFYNSRWNHAQFNPSTNTFTLYEEMVTPNFMMYPFGNFMPFFDIVHDCKRSSDIDKAYLQEIAKSALYKYNTQGVGSEYNTLSTNLNQFIRLMDAAFTSGWSAKDCVNKYFEKSGIPKVYPDNTELEQYYTLDYDEPSNFYFGMNMEMNFIQPKGGMTGLTGQEELVFYFTGDDDVWVYLDGVLFLDLSGIHRHVGGKIDFVRGQVSYYELSKETGDVGDTPYQSISFADILTAAGKSTAGLNEAGTFADYSIHNFKFYYMERGAGSGVCRMNFNLPLLRENSISITKDISALNGNVDDIIGDPYFTFRILKAKSGIKAAGDDQLFVSEGTPYDIYDSAGNYLETRQVGAGGIISIKKGDVAVISGIMSDAGKYYVCELISSELAEQYDNIYVDGKEITTVDGVVVGSEEYIGLSSPVKDISAGNTTFSYNNIVDMTELGHLSLKKEVVGTGDYSDRVYEFKIEIDSIPLETSYVFPVITVDGNTRGEVVKSGGIIGLKPGEKLVIDNLIAGSEYRIEEIGESIDDYIITYETNGEVVYGSTVTGIIEPSTDTLVNATNSEKGTTVNIPGRKTLLNASGIQQQYTFTMRQCTDITGSETLGDDFTSTVTMPEGTGELEGEFFFTLNYMEGDVSEGTTKFYYKITENENPDAASYTVFDESVFVAEVTVTRRGSNISAALTGMYKDGESIGKSSKAHFVNEMTSNLLITKTVRGDSAEDSFNRDFRFIITLTDGETPLSGSFSGTKTSAEGNESEISLSFTDGIANTTLKHGESLTVRGIPLGTAYTVEEDAAGYYIYHVINSGLQNESDIAEGTLSIGRNEVAFHNYTMRELPATGGIGTETIYLFGAALMALSAIMLLKKKKRKTQI